MSSGMERQHHHGWAGLRVRLSTNNPHQPSKERANWKAPRLLAHWGVCLVYSFGCFLFFLGLYYGELGVGKSVLISNGIPLHVRNHPFWGSFLSLSFVFILMRPLSGTLFRHGDWFRDK
ncbi:hypothetical protein B0T19DRAFT_434398 [Cercophora scortea]|uniref:Uncharacterized protein n=1 Tax=Cercophora scortea TaxID=314031 RepID=A0AAE0M2R2_9PEZI|nr:hypothetical protein B0T19DRAFT_434398 [Cercophora scortea]